VSSCLTLEVKDFPFVVATQGLLRIRSLATFRTLLVEGITLSVERFAFTVVLSWQVERESPCQPKLDHQLVVSVLRIDSTPVDVIGEFELKMLNVDDPANTAQCTRVLEYPAYPETPHDILLGPMGPTMRDILDPQGGWLRDGSLTLVCRVKACSQGTAVKVMSAPLEDSGQEALLLQALSQDLGTMLDSGHGADVLLHVGGESLPAHSFVLMARSPVFRAMCSHEMQEKTTKEVVIEALDPVSVKEMLRYMYTGQAANTLQDSDYAEGVLEAANRYQVAGLVELCTGSLGRSLSCQNAARRLMLADLVGEEAFRSRCLAFITSSSSVTKAVQRTDGFKELTKQRPHLVADILSAAFPPDQEPRARVELKRRRVDA